jgi:alkylation response protein AidB-like acyl-CoA dehydrogenase
MAITITTDVSAYSAEAQVEQRTAWFEEHADELDAGISNVRTLEVLQLLASQGLLGIGVPRSLGGEGGSTREALSAIADVAERSLTSGYLLWSQRASIELLVSTGNPWLQANLLPRLLAGETSGATDLLLRRVAPHDKLGVRATRTGDGLVLDGFVPWASNLRPEGFVLATAVHAGPGRTAIVAVPSSADGIVRSADHPLLGLRASWTASVRLDGVALSDAWVVSDRADAFLTRVQPNLILLQSALAVGVTRRAVAELGATKAGPRPSWGARADSVAVDLASLEATLATLAARPLADVGRGIRAFAARQSLTRLALRAVHLELEAAGINGYRDPAGTARRIREATILPVIGPAARELEAGSLIADPGRDGFGSFGWAA